MNETLTLNQLLGRISYFHVLLIEPALPTHTAKRLVSSVERRCCHHPAPTLELGSWAILREVAESLGMSPTCAPDQRDCCSICRIRAHGAAIVACWAEVETYAHDRTHDGKAIAHAAVAGGDLLANSYMSQQGVRCRTARIPEPFLLGLPLTDELLSLWYSPGRAPVVSQLNHCTDLTDVVRLVKENAAP